MVIATCLSFLVSKWTHLYWRWLSTLQQVHNTQIFSKSLLIPLLSYIFLAYCSMSLRQKRKKQTFQTDDENSRIDSGLNSSLGKSYRLYTGESTRSASGESSSSSNKRKGNSELHFGLYNYVFDEKWAGGDSSPVVVTFFSFGLEGVDALTSNQIFWRETRMHKKGGSSPLIVIFLRTQCHWGFLRKCKKDNKRRRKRDRNVVSTCVRF